MFILIISTYVMISSNVYTHTICSQIGIDGLMGQKKMLVSSVNVVVKIKLRIKILSGSQKDLLYVDIIK